MKFPCLIHRTLLVAFCFGHALTAEARVYFTFADVAERVVQGVVNIRTTGPTQGRERTLDPYQFFMQGKIPRTAQQSLGSGVVVQKKNLILTNYHVVQGASLIEIMTAKAKAPVKANIIGVDRKTDLALLQTEKDLSATVLEFADSNLVRIGDIVLAVGNPFGYGHTVTSGIVSAKSRIIGAGPYDDFLQTDAPVNPGNSGGPLVDLRGRVVGINTAVSADGPGIGFSLPANVAKAVVQELLAKGKVARPYAGILLKPAPRDQDAGRYDLTSGGMSGVIVENLVQDGPAHRSGIKVGDIIVNFDNDRIYDIHDFEKLLLRKNPRDQVALKLYRKQTGQYVKIKVKLDETPAAEEMPADATIL